MPAVYTLLKALANKTALQHHLKISQNAAPLASTRRPFHKVRTAKEKEWAIVNVRQATLSGGTANRWQHGTKGHRGQEGSF